MIRRAIAVVAAPVVLAVVPGTVAAEQPPKLAFNGAIERPAE